MLTVAEDCGSHWKINGAKKWVTNGTICDVFVLWAKTDAGIQGFLCPRDTEGVHFQDIHNKMSLRASVSAECTLENVELPKDAILPGARGLGTALNCLNQARYGIIWVY